MDSLVEEDDDPATTLPPKTDAPRPPSTAKRPSSGQRNSVLKRASVSSSTSLHDGTREQGRSSVMQDMAEASDTLQATVAEPSEMSGRVLGDGVEQEVEEVNDDDPDLEGFDVEAAIKEELERIKDLPLEEEVEAGEIQDEVLAPAVNIVPGSQIDLTEGSPPQDPLGDSSTGLKPSPTGSGNRRQTSISAQIEAALSRPGSGTFLTETPLGASYVADISTIDLAVGSSLEFELPEELKREKEALERRLRDLDKEQKSEESLLDALRMDNEQSLLRRPVQKKRLQKPRIRHSLASNSSTEGGAEAAPWLSKEDLLTPRDSIAKSISANSSMVSIFRPPSATSSSANLLDLAEKAPFRSRRSSSEMGTGPTISIDKPGPENVQRAVSESNLAGTETGLEAADDIKTFAVSNIDELLQLERELTEEELAALANEERALQIEIQKLQQALKDEAEKQAQLQLKLETQQSSNSINRRALRAMKMKVRDIEDQYRQIIHWLSVVAKVAFEKEKDRSNALLQKCARLTEKQKKKHEQYNLKMESAKRKCAEFADSRIKLSDDIAGLKESAAKAEAEVEKLKADYEELAMLVGSKKDEKEKELLQKLQAEEAQRQLEIGLLKEACARQRPSKPVEYEDLLIYNPLMNIDPIGPNDIIQIIEVNGTEAFKRNVLVTEA
ncbi:hypothetical protein HDU96_003215 [Phlyctochytrium bullatum]|nr:hypothetical protein HDU96_003215 [Phlyctochytrium bullatum]